MSDYVCIEIDKILRETDKAFLVRIDGDETWLPKSQMADWEDYEVGDVDLEISVTEWIAKEKELL